MSKKRRVHKNKYAHLVSKKDRSHLKPFTPQATLDYHNRGPLSKFEIEKLFEDFLLESYTDGLDRVLIITGKGQVVRPIVAKSLKNNSLVQKSSKAGYYNGQSGAFEVYLKKD